VSTLFRSFRQGTAEFDQVLARLQQRGGEDLARVDAQVREVIAEVRKSGDAAVKRYVAEFEKRTVTTLFSRDYGGEAALAGLSEGLQDALRIATGRIRSFHQRQAKELGAFEYTEGGVTLGTRVRPLDRIAVYAPGGKARYPSSVLMCAVVARVAGVREVVVATPDPGPEVRAACHLANVDAVLDAGGAQAIAALAYGTESVPRVDKIVGPGNVYVTSAKKQVYGDVGIDGIAGPSEILVITDDSANAEHVAADLLSQAEHDEAAYPLLLSTSSELVIAVENALAHQLAALPRREVAEVSLRQNGVALVVTSRSELARIATLLAVEHVAIQTREPRKLADEIGAAGALFLGASTPEAAGDYVAGPSHVLPTGGAARFGSPLGVYDFVTRSSVIGLQAHALVDLAQPIETLAEAEGLTAHARAVSIRTRP
jgi:histidinol dehydrogenase